MTKRERGTDRIKNATLPADNLSESDDAVPTRLLESSALYWPRMCADMGNNGDGNALFARVSWAKYANKNSTSTKCIELRNANLLLNQKSEQSDVVMVSSR